MLIHLVEVVDAWSGEAGNARKSEGKQKQRAAARGQERHLPIRPLGEHSWGKPVKRLDAAEFMEVPSDRSDSS
jgi:hypothetical protein